MPDGRMAKRESCSQFGARISLKNKGRLARGVMCGLYATNDKQTTNSAHHQATLLSACDVSCLNYNPRKLGDYQLRHPQQRTHFTMDAIELTLAQQTFRKIQSSARLLYRYGGLINAVSNNVPALSYSMVMGRVIFPAELRNRRIMFPIEAISWVSRSTVNA